MVESAKVKTVGANYRIYEQMKLVDKDAGYHLANMNDKTNQHYEIELSKTKRSLGRGIINLI